MSGWGGLSVVWRPARDQGSRSLRAERCCGASCRTVDGSDHIRARDVKVLAGKLVSFRRSLDVRLNVQGVRLDELYACKAILGKPCWIFRLESLPASMTRCKMNLQDASLLSPSAPFHLFSKWGLMGSGKDPGLCRIRHKLDHVGLCVMSDR